MSTLDKFRAAAYENVKHEHMSLPVGKYVRALEAENATLQAKLAAIQSYVDKQAKDEALWFIPDSVVEAYFQQELRRLHEVIEWEAGA